MVLSQQFGIKNLSLRQVLSSGFTAKKIRISLGILWLLDGLLQLQPKMFTAGFITRVIDPAKLGQPGFVSWPIHIASVIFLKQPFLCDLAIAIVQITIGLLIMFKKTKRSGLLASVGWSMVVWYIGEGLGGLLTGNSLIITGAPGAALLYGILALAVYLVDIRANQRAKIANWLAYVWLVLWGTSLPYMLWSKMTSQQLTAMFQQMSLSAPGWLIHINQSIANLLAGSGIWFALGFGLLCLVIGVSVFAPRPYKAIGIWAGILLSLIFWFVGQDLGGFYSGYATDLNSGPLYILLGLAVLNVSGIKLKLFDEDLALD